MARDEEEYPKPVESLPNEPLSFSFLRQLREEGERIRKISVRRFTSTEAIDGDHQEILELSSGLIPTDVEEFLVYQTDKILFLEFDQDCWWVTAKIQRGEGAGQFLAHITKPYIGLRRIDEHMYINKS